MRKKIMRGSGKSVRKRERRIEEGVKGGMRGKGGKSYSHINLKTVVQSVMRT